MKKTNQVYKVKRTSDSDGKWTWTRPQTMGQVHEGEKTSPSKQVGGVKYAGKQEAEAYTKK